MHSDYSMRLLTLAFAGAVFILAPPAWAGPRFEPQLPSVGTWELAEESRVRPLTAPEVATVSGNWYSTYIYLESALQASMLHGNGHSYLMLTARPTDRCLNAAMFDLISAAEDGAITGLELESLWNANGRLAYLAHQIGTAGGDNAFLRAKASDAGFIPDGIGGTVVGEYYDLLAHEPASISGKVEFVTRRTVMYLDLGSARLIEFGSVGRDALWSALAEPTPEPSDRRGVLRRESLLVQSIVAFGAVNDPRIHSLPSTNMPFIHGKTREYLDDLATRPPGKRDLRYERPVLFFEGICWFHRYGAKTP